MNAHILNKNILRKYDIRGIIGVDLSYDDAVFIGMSIATILIRKGIFSICVGRDGRLSSEKLRDSLVSGITKCGVSVIDVGLVPTPCLYFSVYNLGQNAGVMITGSHNPKDYNGFKIMIKDEAFYGDSVLEIGKICESGAFLNSGRDASVSNVDISAKYIDEITSFIDKSSVNVCIDAGNGASGQIVTDVAKKIGIPQDNLLFCDIDGNFPNHHPDPTIEKNMKDLANLVIEKKADFGIGLDGDADRIGIVDDKGRFVYGDTLLCILSKFLLLEVPNATIISDVKASKVVFDEIKRLGGNGIMWQSGHSLIKDKMKKTGAALAGEMSGHVFYKHGYYGYDDGIFAGMKLIEIVQKHKVKISDLIDALPKTVTSPEITVKVDESQKFEIMGKIIHDFKAKYTDFIDIDGIRVNFDFGWLLVRASNTTNCLVIRFEADNSENLAKLFDTTHEVLNRYELNLKQ
ncbi:phosphomannomutase/phosphoglucomutase [Candidatus Deianiraea vastatrix]|uniref:Phosphomannomutase/phosphoglucomutase n=1 Tax=Candidatus Deianiraea vastatrix TaxID=2163644 RepID=A0A5B8XCW5_9RICK|nr:phosphomannomutase/phosphoglucomutase [Candidatus Deianiraea vastatrix]QED22866.1 Phosphomannomutase/phosphoglucomutase [Candidatus Deianiraea vastatrix]